MDVFNPTAEQLSTRENYCEKHGKYRSKAITLPIKTLSGEAKTIWTQCPECARLDVERDKVEKDGFAEQAKQKRIEERLNRAGIPRRFRERSFDNFVASTEPMQFALETARNFAQNFQTHASQGSTMIFAGNVGTGKGHLSIAIAQQVLAQGKSALFATAREIVMMLRERWTNPAAPSEMEVLRMLTNVSLLVIDEVGVQFGTDAERDQLFAVIDGRYRDLMPTILTTNLNRKQLQAVLGERSYSRLREDGTWVSFDWQDHRAFR